MPRVTSTILAILIGVYSLVLPKQAVADELHTHAEVVCRAGVNAALVRFTTAWNEDAPVYRRLPQTVDSGLSKAAPSERDNCVIANGWTIRIRSGDEQAFAYGMGGGDPPAFFSLWIARHKVISRKEWKPGYSEKGPWIVALVVRPDHLTTCRVSNGSDEPANGVLSCTDEPLRLDRYKVDRIEYAKPGTRPPVGTMLVLPGPPAPKICGAYLRLRGDSWPDSYMMVDSAKILHSISASPEQRLAEAIIEVAPGVRRKLIDWGSDGHFFDGDLMFLAPVSADPRTVLKPEFADRLDEKAPTDALPTGWQLISGGQPSLYPDVSVRYVHFDTQKIAGRIYLLAQPTNRKERPTAILVEPLASGFRTVCRFQRIEPNF